MDEDSLNSMESSAESDTELQDSKQNKIVSTGTKHKPGIIYLSKVPTGFNVSQTTSFFSDFGRVGRVFLQPDKNDRKPGKFNRDRVFTEGWIEFKSKKIAKTVAESLNSYPVGGKRRSKAHDELWNIKYLPRFKWIHLSERLAYEAAVKQQRLRTEISQVKREAEHFKSSVERKRKKSKKEKVTGEDSTKDQIVFQFKQRETDAQIRKRRREENVFTVKDINDVETKPNKRAKKSKKEKEEQLVKVQVRSKRGKKEKHSDSDRSQFLKSVFGGGGAD